MTTRITSPRNERVQFARRLRRRTARDREGAFLVEGPVVVREALEAGAPVGDVFVVPGHPDAAGVRALADAAGAPVHEVSAAILDSICDTTTPQGIAAVVAWEPRPTTDLLRGTPLVVVLGSVRDPGNAGMLVRSALAAGATGVVVAKGSVDALHPKTVRASAGAIFRLPVIRERDLESALADLQDAGLRLVGADAASTLPFYDVDLTAPVALVLGNESWGIPEAIRSSLDVTVGIPMPGPAESLNVGTAGAILLFEAVRQRRLSSALR